MPAKDAQEILLGVPFADDASERFQCVADRNTSLVRVVRQLVQQVCDRIPCGIEYRGTHPSVIAVGQEYARQDVRLVSVLLAGQLKGRQEPRIGIAAPGLFKEHLHRPFSKLALADFQVAVCGEFLLGGGRGWGGGF